jgi:hypothetical protein
MAQRLLSETTSDARTKRRDAPGFDRPDTLMLKIERSTDGEGARFAISGRIEAAHIAELQRLVDEEQAVHRPVVLDLGDVTLVDPEVVSFFERCETNGVRLENCPAYVREWIAMTRDETRGHRNRHQTPRP